MASRTRQTVASFTSSFVLPGLDAPELLVKYRVDHNEVPLDTASRQAWLRVASIHLPAVAVRGRAYQLAPIGSADLDDALERELTK